ncbi:MAG: hypothetical protein KDC44_06250 [Phaeodactylibacter sp.]|nr:hypothetical protein [Phaeodactylibacter sp.]
MSKSVLAYGVTLCFLLFGCNNPAVEHAGEHLDEAGASVARAVEIEKEKVQSDLQQARQNINRQIQKLESNLEETTEEGRQEINQQIANLQAFGRRIDAQMEVVGERVEDGWEQFKSDTGELLRDINAAFKEYFSG